MDNVSKQERSRIMASVPSRGNRTTELALGKELRAAGLRGYRKHWPVEGHPDFAWPKLKVAVFVDGCFWHGCTRCRSLPHTNRQFWKHKIDNNRQRDRRVNRRLRYLGWCVLRVRECAVSAPGAVSRIARAVTGRKIVACDPAVK
jgi:DNA mismatch endonuclease (patch repair protein)